MKILFANKFFYLKGGSETILFQERDFLIKKGYEVIDFSMEDYRNFPSKYSSFFVSNIDYQNLKSLKNKIQKGYRLIHSSEAIRNIKRLIQEESPDIAHLHNIYHHLTPSIIPILKKSNIKVVLILHDYKLICPSYSMSNKGKICDECDGKHFWKMFITNCQESTMNSSLLMLEAYWHKWRKSYDYVDLFIASSQFMAEMISRQIPKNKIEIIHNGVDINEYKDVEEDDGYALYFGRISQEKGIETLLKTHQLLSCKITIKVVGDGPLRKTLKRKYQDVEFTGFKTGAELKDLVHRASYVVVPSEWYENCSLSVLEAMASGKAVIGSRIGGIPEQIEDGKTGLLFEMGNSEDLADKMVHLSSNRNLRRKMGAAARKKVEEEYSLEAHCSKLLRLYQKLLAKNRKLRNLYT